MEATIDLWEIPPEMRNTRRASGSFPSRAAAAPHRALHVSKRLGARPVHGFGHHGGRRDPHAAFLCGVRHRQGLRRASSGALPRRARPMGVRCTRSTLVASSRPLGDARRLRRGAESQQRAVKEGRKAQEIARSVLQHCGFRNTRSNVRTKSGVEIDFVVEDEGGTEWYVDVSGAFTTTRAGLRRTDTLWKSLGKAAVLKVDGAQQPILLLTTDLPVRGSAGDTALRKARDVEDRIIHDAIEMLSEAGQERLARYADGEHFGRPEGELLHPSARDINARGNSAGPGRVCGRSRRPSAGVHRGGRARSARVWLLCESSLSRAPESLPSPAAVEELRECLLEERWADTIFSWVGMSGIAVDAYPDEVIWTEAALDAEHAALEVRMSPLFRD